MTLTPEFMTIVTLCSSLVTIFGLIKIIRTPFDSIKKNQEKIVELERESKKHGEIDKAILNGLQAITNHMIDGNGINELKASRSELQHAISDIATHS